MPGDQQFTRIDLVEAKIQITKKIGAQKAEKYFNLLGRFFSKKLSKSEFDKLCIVTVGRENIGLHNWLIRSIVANASFSKTPPAKAGKQGGEGAPVNGKTANGYQISCRQSIYRDSVPQSPRRLRTLAIRDGKYGDRPSPLGPLGKPHAVICGEAAPKVLEQQSAVVSVEDGEEVVQSAGSPGVNIRKHLTAPLGVQFRPSPTRKKVLSPLSSSPFTPMETCYSTGGLPDSVSLWKRMEQKVMAEGIRVTPECANLLNSSLNMYLKRMIKPCLELATSASARRQNEEVRFHTVPGMNGMQPGRFVQRPTSYACASLVDMRAAMEMNPHLLGEDMSLQLEKLALQQDQDWQLGAGSSFSISDPLLQSSSAQMYK